MAQTFLNLVTDNRNMQESLVTRAFAYREKEGRAMPGILTLSVALVFAEKAGGNAAGERYLLLAHRARRKGGFYDDRWSASFEEQFNPAKWVEAVGEGFKEHPADTSVLETVVRGLREELITDSYKERIRPYVLRPLLSFQTSICTYWRWSR